MITLTDSTVIGAPGMTLAELDAVTVGMSTVLGGPTTCPEIAADFLRDVYSLVIRSAGAVMLTLPEQTDLYAGVAFVRDCPVRVAA